MKGIKKHTHKQRIHALEEMVPLIKQRFGDNLIAIAARGSTARNTDGPYSDVELFAFLKEMPEGDPLYGKSREIKDGLLVELLWLTKETYIQEVKEVSPSWFGSGADILMPLYNESFIQTINDFVPENKKEKCCEQAIAMWEDVQRKSNDVLKIAEEGGHPKMALAFHRMYDGLLNFLAFINQTPYTTYSQKIQEAERFAFKPASFLKLTEILLDGKFYNYLEIEEATKSAMRELRESLQKLGHKLGEESFLEDHIEKPDSFGVKDLETKLEQAAAVWDKVQEATTKVLNAVEAKNISGMAIVLNDMFFQYLKVLSCVNGKPLGFSQTIDDARSLEYQPQGFSNLINVVENGEYKNLSKIERTVVNIFTELEGDLEKSGLKLYQD